MKFTENKNLQALVNVWVLRVRAMDLAMGEARLIEFLKADRAVWSELITNPYGSLAASFFGFAIVSWTDSVEKVHNLAEEDAAPIVAMARLHMVDAAVQLIMRVEPSTNTVDARDEVVKQLYGTKDG